MPKSIVGKISFENTLVLALITKTQGYKKTLIQPAKLQENFVQENWTKASPSHPACVLALGDLFLLLFLFIQI